MINRRVLGRRLTALVILTVLSARVLVEADDAAAPERRSRTGFSSSVAPKRCRRESG